MAKWENQCGSVLWLDFNERWKEIRERDIKKGAWWMASIGPYKKRLISEGGTDPTGFARFIVSSRERRENLARLYPFSLPFFPPAKNGFSNLYYFSPTSSYSQSRNANPASVKEAIDLRINSTRERATRRKKERRKKYISNSPNKWIKRIINF